MDKYLIKPWTIINYPLPPPLLSPPPLSLQMVHSDEYPSNAPRLFQGVYWELQITKFFLKISMTWAILNSDMEDILLYNYIS